MLGEAQASGLQGAHSYSLSSRPETAPKTLRHPPVQPPARPKPLPAPREVLALLPAPSSLLSLLARPFCKYAHGNNKYSICNLCDEEEKYVNTPQTLCTEKEREGEILFLRKYSRNQESENFILADLPEISSKFEGAF